MWKSRCASSLWNHLWNQFWVVHSKSGRRKSPASRGRALRSACFAPSLDAHTIHTPTSFAKSDPGPIHDLALTLTTTTLTNIITPKLTPTLIITLIPTLASP